MNNNLYIIIGASATGKGALMDQLCKEGLWTKVKKYSTRAYRGVTDDIVYIDNDELSELVLKEKKLKELIDKKIQVDYDTIKWELTNIQNLIREKRLDIINDFCGDGKGIVYFLNGNFYGIYTYDIEERLKTNNLVVVCSDFNVIQKLQNDKKLSKYIRIVYIASSIDEKELIRRYKLRECVDFSGVSGDILSKIGKMTSIIASAGRLKYFSKIEEIMPEFNECWNNTLPYFDTIKARAFNIRLLYNRYIDNIAKIDCPILNFYDLEYMFEQQRNFILKKDEKEGKNFPPVFMVCAAPSSGKATLMSIIGGIGKVNKNVVITKKYAKRIKRPTDGRDGMEAIGPNGKFEDYINNKKDIWSWSFHNSRIEYAVDISEIKRNISKGIAQIFISNMGQIKKAKKLFPQNLIVLYLHATHESATKNHIIDKRKSDILDEIRKEHDCDLEIAQEIFMKNKKYSIKLEKILQKDISEIREVHIDYMNNNYLIDHVLLNTGTNNDLIEQMINLINMYVQK